MGTIISSGVGSGLNVADLVAQLVEAEGKPQAVRLDVAEAKAQAKLSALATIRSALASFRSALEDLQSIDAFRGRSVTLSKPDFISAAAATNAVPGTYALEVERLASAHRLASQALGSEDDVVGIGTLTVARGATSFVVDVTAENNTLAGIAAAINGAQANPGVVATILTGVEGARLILRSVETGASNSLVVTQSGGDGGLASLVYDPVNMITNLSEIDPAQDARVLIDTFPVESTTNSISGAIQGLDISLLAANTVGETTSISIGYDKPGARETIDKLVDSYNGLVDAVASVASFDAETRAAGPLFGDAGLRNVIFQLRREFGASLDGTFDNLQQIGISIELNGKLSVDAERLDSAFITDFDAIGDSFAAADVGLAFRLDALLEPYLQSGGVLDGRDGTLKATIDDIGDSRESLAQRLTAVEQRLFRQFNALDGLLAQLQTTSAYLTQQLSNLPRADSLLGRNR